MKLKLFSLLVVVAMLVGLFGSATPVKAVGYGTSFSTAVTYMNVGNAEAIISVDFYSENATSVTRSYNVANLPAGAAASLSIGSVFTSAFKGSAVINSNQPLVATMVQLPQGNTTVKNRTLSNGFSSGSTKVLVATALKQKFNGNSIISVQNAGNAAANVSVAFTATTDGNSHTYTVNLAPGAARYYDLNNLSELGPVFNGSVTITSSQPVVATAMELSTTNDAVYAFEGISGGATTVYMPTAQCKYGASVATTYYAVQATDSAANVSVRFLGTANGTNIDKTINYGSVPAGEKVSVAGCGVQGNAINSNFLGSAVITASAPVVSIGKIQGEGPTINFAAAHLGASSGSARLAAPYVRFTNQFYQPSQTITVQRAYIAIQNVGSSALAANSVTISFRNAAGQVQGSTTNKTSIAPGGKFSVTAADAGVPEFGYTTGANGQPSNYGGGAIIQGPSGSQLTAIVRVQTITSNGTEVAEDYNAVPLQ